MASKVRNTGLGRGLGALFENQEKPAINNGTEEIDIENSILNLDINSLCPNENQPRKKFEQDGLNELAESIKEHGIIQPVIVRETLGGYEIVAGERRWRAARIAGLREIPCILKTLSDEENMLLAIIENMQRKDLDPIEEAMGLEQMINVYKMTQSEVSKSVGKSRPYIANSLRLLKLPNEIQDFVSEGKITAGHARALVTIENTKKQIEICNRIINENLSVRDVEKLVKEGDKKPEKKKATKKKSPEVKAVERQLKEFFGTKVNIKEKGKKGRIEIEYYSIDGLNRIIELLEQQRNK